MLGVKLVDLDHTLGTGWTHASGTSPPRVAALPVYLSDWLVVELGYLGKSVLGRENKRKDWSIKGGQR